MVDIWSIVKTMKRETPLDKDCKTEKNDMLYADIFFQVKEFEKKMEMRPNGRMFENTTNELLGAAAEMFIYINICPCTLASDSANTMEQWFKSWYTFYQDLFRTQPPSYIILTLNRLMKSGNNLKDKIRAEKLFKRTGTLLALKYEEIQRIMPEEAIRVSDQEDTRHVFKSEGTNFCICMHQKKINKKII